MQAVDEKMRDPELKAVIDEAARLIVELSRNASPEWGKRQGHSSAHGTMKRGMGSIFMPAGGK